MKFFQKHSGESCYYPTSSVADENSRSYLPWHGGGGALLAKREGEITFLDICRAVDAVHADGLFHFHEHPNPRCPVGLSIHQALDGKLAQVQQAMEKEMNDFTCGCGSWYANKISL